MIVAYPFKITHFFFTNTTIVSAVKNVTLRFPPTQVPNLETNYFCMTFELPQDGDYHMIATKPFIDNEYVMHHILLYGCDETGMLLFL